MIRRPPRSTLDRSSAASDVYKRQLHGFERLVGLALFIEDAGNLQVDGRRLRVDGEELSLIHISEPTRPY